MNFKLSPAEQELINKISASFNLDPATKSKAIDFFQEYKEYKDINERLDLSFACAILAASRSQSIKTVNGEKARGIGISITQLMKVNNRTQDGLVRNKEFFGVLKDFLKSVALESLVVQGLQQTIDKFAFTSTFFTKFNNIIDELGIIEDEEYIINFGNIGWLLFINAKQHVLNNQTEFVDSVYMLTATFVHLLYYLPPKVKVSYFEKRNRNIREQDSQQRLEMILEGIEEMLKFHSNREDFFSHKSNLDEYLQKMCRTEGVKTKEVDSFEGMLDKENIHHNLKVIERYYQKKLDPDEFDECYYVRDKEVGTPSKFTPFARQGAANKLLGSMKGTPGGEEINSGIKFVINGKRSFQSQRVLDYEISDNVNANSFLRDIKVVNKAIAQSPAPRIPNTPMTAALQMYNWLNEKVKKIKKIPSDTLQKFMSTLPESEQKEILSRVDRLIKNVLDRDMEEEGAAISRKGDYKNQIRVLYFKVLEELLLEEEKKVVGSSLADILLNEDFHKALIACCIETTFFVNNYTNENLSFMKLLELCDTQPFEFWRIITSFVRFDKNMPVPIRKHMHELETKIVTQLAWKRGSQVYQLVTQLFEQSKNGELETPINSSTTTNVATQEEAKNSSHMESQQSEEKADIFKAPCPSGSQVSFSSTAKKPKKIDFTYSQQAFFKRVLTYAALEIQRISELLKINEKISEQIWTTIKYVLSTETSLLIDRHLTQLIVCTIYGVCKSLGHSFKFQEIIQKYQELPNMNFNELSNLFHHTLITGNNHADVITFYNSVYLATLKPHLNSLSGNRTGEVDSKSYTPLLRPPVIPHFAIASPLRESLPQCNSALSRKSPMVRSGVTPTNHVYAFGESPRRALDKINGALSASKRIIKFDDNEQDSNHKEKKFLNPVLDRIMDLKNDRNDESEESQRRGLSRGLSGQFMSSQGSLFRSFMSSEDIQSQESNRSDYLTSHSNMISEFNSSTLPTQTVLSSRILPLGFENIKQLQAPPQKQQGSELKLASNTMGIEEKSQEGEKTLTPEFKK